MRKSHARDEKLRKLFEQVAEAGGIELEEFDPDACDNPELPWEEKKEEHTQGSQAAAAEFFSQLPGALDPAPWLVKKPDRAGRKRAQMHALVMLALRVVKDGDTVVDFGAGAGHLGLLIAYLRPSCTVILVEPETYHVEEQARRRMEELGLANCRVFASGVEQFAASGESFDCGVSLHSCGTITDKALTLCVSRRARFCLCPCCYGEVAETGLLPRSEAWAEHFDKDDFLCFSSAADTVAVKKTEDWLRFPWSPAFARAKRCMRIVDADRMAWAVQVARYQTVICSLLPLACSPKNDVILGVPTEESGPPEEIPLPIDKFTPDECMP